MAIEESNTMYECSVCGRQVMVLKVGTGTLLCCGKEMTNLGINDAWRSFLDEVKRDPRKLFDTFFGSNQQK